MKSVQVFDFDDYKLYLTRVADAAEGGKRRGFKSALAQAAECQLAYLSRVFGGDAHLNLEQAEGISRFLGHSEDQERFFLTLIQWNRAGTRRLRDYFKRELETIRRAHETLEVRFKVNSSLSLEDQQIYYSSWIYAATHVLISVPALQNKEAIRRHLGISLRKIGEILDFLLATGLAHFQDGRYLMGTTRIHLGSSSPLVGKHHLNWRVQGMRAFDRDQSDAETEDLHYSSVVSLSARDFARIKRRFIQVIEEYNAIVRDSPEELGACLALDFFQI